MISAVFSTSGGRYVGFEVGGHSGLAEAGNDVLCAAVSAATELAANLIGGVSSVDERNAKVRVRIPSPDENSERVVSAFIRQLKSYSEEYPENITVTEQECVL
ncbi:MAG: ribosomal-processing cysteine protease Prp [Clostridia bacterium]|nr:ribosomal-processing cysteine protease Prp [Clostridia bacterium]